MLEQESRLIRLRLLARVRGLRLGFRMQVCGFRAWGAKESLPRPPEGSSNVVASHDRAPRSICCGLSPDCPVSFTAHLLCPTSKTSQTIADGPPKHHLLRPTTWQVHIFVRRFCSSPLQLESLLISRVFIIVILVILVIIALIVAIVIVVM